MHAFSLYWKKNYLWAEMFFHYLGKSALDYSAAMSMSL